jgi:hypothetical protein
MLTVSESASSEGIEFADLGDPISLRGTTGHLRQHNERGLSLRWQEDGLVIFISATTPVAEALKVAQSLH